MEACSEDLPDRDESLLKDPQYISCMLEDAMQTYKNATPKSIAKFRQSLLTLLTPDALACFLCRELVKRNNQIWTCQGCYCIFHLSCARRWARNFANPNSDAACETAVTVWLCPKCEWEYKDMLNLLCYLCFCGKAQNPKKNSFTVPHSCRQPCSKLLRPLCGHYCTLLCHPGPCPPCTEPVFSTCYCGKSEPQKVSCSRRDWNCTRLCRKLLSCNKHYCKNQCHNGNCKPCAQSEKVLCICGSETRLRPCKKSLWHCSKVCKKPLNCGNHYCALKCHDGNCPPCPTFKPRPCPCKATLQQIPCTYSSVPTCDNICGKVLFCGKHTCRRKCHLGPCNFCEEEQVMKCRCGKVEKSLECRKELLCDNQCQEKRNCGKHNCNQKCCVKHRSCVSPCLKILNCGVHKCSKICHTHPCLPCKEMIEVKCSCGSVRKSQLCGQKSFANLPCVGDCILPSDCHHGKPHKHKCHVGQCPPCQKVCGQRLSCGHLCPVKCHSVKTKMKLNSVDNAIESTKMQLIDQPCPPCTAIVSIDCIGKHTTRKFKCSAVKTWFCEKRCGRILPCLSHICAMPCHEVGFSYYDETDNRHCILCDEPCSKKRPDGCSHKCTKTCHPGDCKRCVEFIELICHCKRRTRSFPCYKWTEADEAGKRKWMRCRKACPKKLTCGHRCPRFCHPGACPDSKSVCWKKVLMMCPCKNLKSYKECWLVEDAMKCDETCLTRVLTSNKNLDESEECFEDSSEEEAQECLKDNKEVSGTDNDAPKTDSSEDLVSPAATKNPKQRPYCQRKYLFFIIIIISIIVIFTQVILPPKSCNIKLLL